jgi:hypothetical protein
MFCSSVVRVCVFARYGTTSLGNWWSAFRENAVDSKTGVLITQSGGAASKKNGGLKYAVFRYY